MFAAEQKANGFANTKVTEDTTVDGAHGRIETWTTTVIHDVEWIRDLHDWPGLQSVVMVESERDRGDKVEKETRFYLTSPVMMAALFGPVVQSHRAIENSLHWIMDMNFRDDECRARTDHAPANFTTIKHIAHNLIRRASSKDSLRVRRKVAAWYDDFLPVSPQRKKLTGFPCHPRGRRIFPATRGVRTDDDGPMRSAGLHAAGWGSARVDQPFPATRRIAVDENLAKYHAKIRRGVVAAEPLNAREGAGQFWWTRTLLCRDGEGRAGTSPRRRSTKCL